MTVGWCCVCRCVRCRHHWRCQPHQPLSECSRGKKKHSARSTRSTFLSMIFVAPSRFSCFVREHRPVSIYFLRILFRHIFFSFGPFCRLAFAQSSESQPSLWCRVHCNWRSLCVRRSPVLCGKSLFRLPFLLCHSNRFLWTVAGIRSPREIKSFRVGNATHRAPTSKNSVLKNFILLPNKFFVHECACMSVCASCDSRNEIRKCAKNAMDIRL